MWHGFSFKYQVRGHAWAILFVIRVFGVVFCVLTHYESEAPYESGCTCICILLLRSILGFVVGKRVDFFEFCDEACPDLNGSACPKVRVLKGVRIIS